MLAYYKFSSLYTAPKANDFNYHRVEILNHGVFLPTFSDFNMARFLFIGGVKTRVACRPYSSRAKMNFDAVCFNYEHNHSCNVRSADYSHNTVSTNWFASLGCYW